MPLRIDGAQVTRLATLPTEKRRQGHSPKRLIILAGLTYASAGRRHERYSGSVTSRPSLGAPVPDDPMKNFRPSSKVTSRPLARALRSLL